jgi:hypothetical protein
MRRFNVDDLEQRPTLAQGQCCDLKVDTGDFRVWLCRVNKGEISYETLDAGRWVPANRDGEPLRRGS